ncbi:HNH endonuclease signature motif containing protein [Mediterranea massiliensis]|uniref:HNH endonuclease n=1 Tax=Mediterranea massiliensis TaxID=1841865 RepID=UPI003209CA09
MAHSLYLSRLTSTQREELIRKLWEIQKHKCFICGKEIDLDLHKNDIDIDHVIPLQAGGKDDESNLAITFSSANRSKQAKDLNLARIEWNYRNLQEKLKAQGRELPNLADVLMDVCGNEPLNLIFKDNGTSISFTFSALGHPEIITVPVYTDALAKERYFFCNFPIEFINHDATINPRAIGPNVFNLIEEFYKGNPQLHVSLGYIQIADDKESCVKLFDGQHKAAAQIMLGVKEIPVRVFIDPDIDKLRKSNLNAGTKLKQVAFDKSVQRNLGSTIYFERVKRYQMAKELSEDCLSFSEKDLINFYSGESREIKKYILDAVRTRIIRHEQNKLVPYIEMGGKAKDKPLSYSSIEKTFFSFFISQDALSTTLDYRSEEGLNPRYLEVEQIVKLMNIIADKIVIGKFDLDKGTNQIENKIQKGEEPDWNHVVAYRMLKEEIMYVWLGLVKDVISQYYLISEGMFVGDGHDLFQRKFPTNLWRNIENFIVNLSLLPLWKSKELSSTIFGGKNNYEFWKKIFVTGKSPNGEQVLPEPLNISKMVISAD